MTTRGMTTAGRGVLGVTLGLAVSSAAPAAQGGDPARGVEIEQRLGERAPLGTEFRDERGRRVALGSYFDEKPVVLVLGYYECPMLCDLVLNGLIETLATLSLDAGEDFRIICVSIDPDEGPEEAAARRKRCAARSGGARGWHFLTGEKASIERLARAVGFRYRYLPEQDEYAHAAGITVLTPGGTVAKYLYGVEYAARDLRLSLVEASDGDVGSPSDQLLLLCLQWNPETGKYGVVILRILRLAGIATVIALACLVWVLSRLGRDRSRTERTS